MWNSLPNELRKVEDFGEFRRLVHTWGGSSCKVLYVNLAKKPLLVFRFVPVHLCFCFYFALVAFYLFYTSVCLYIFSLHVVVFCNFIVLALHPLKV